MAKKRKRPGRVPGSRQTSPRSKAMAWLERLGKEPNEGLVRRYLATEEGLDAEQIDLFITMWRTTGATVSEALNFEWGDVQEGAIQIGGRMERQAPPHLHRLKAKITPAMRREGIGVDTPEPSHRSALVQVLADELPGYADYLDSLDEELEHASALEQAAVFGVFLLTEELIYNERLYGSEVYRKLARRSDGYIPSKKARKDDSLPVAGAFIGSMLGGIWQATEENDLNTQDVLSAAAMIVSNLNRLARWGLGYDASAGLVLFEYGVAIGCEPEELLPLGPLVFHWQRLLWLTECLMEQKIVLGDATSLPVPDDPLEAVRLLLRLSAQQPALANAPDLAQVMPRESKRWVRLDAAANVFEEESAASDPDYASMLAEQLRSERRQPLDHLAVIELSGGSHIRRITLSPERFSESGDMIMLGALIDHPAGSFVALAHLFLEEHPLLEEYPVLEEHPLLDASWLEMMTGRRGTHTYASAFFPGYAGLVPEAVAAAELAILNAWRSLTSTDGGLVEVSREDTAAGDLPVVHYQIGH